MLETLRGQESTRGLDDCIADRALSHHSRQLTVPQPGRRTPAPDQPTCTADFAWPGRWWIAGAASKPPRAATRYERARVATRYERARVASLAVRNAIRATSTAPAAAPADHHHDRAAEAPHGVDHPGRNAALTPAQRAVAVHAHQQAAMPEEYLEGGTTDPATWMRTQANLERLAAVIHAADARRRTIEDREFLTPCRRPGRPAPPGARAAAPAA